MLANALVCTTVPRSTCGQELFDGGLLRIPKLEDTTLLEGTRS
jgi:hypothetical protein